MASNALEYAKQKRALLLKQKQEQEYVQEPEPEFEHIDVPKQTRDVPKQAKQVKKESLAFLFKSNEPKAQKKYDHVLIKRTVKPVKTENVLQYIEAPDTDNGSIRYYYPNHDDIEKYNLPLTKRPWVQKVNGKTVTGKRAYEDPLLYTPGQIYDYVQKTYIDHFENKGIESPFTFTPDNIHRSYEEICSRDEFKLQPHQKFAGAHMSNMTDFPSLLVYHRLGSGKTCTSIIIAESNKGSYINNGNFKKREGSKIPQKYKGDHVSNDICNITVVVPKQTKNQYLEEIRGAIEDGEIRSCTSACIYMEDGTDDSDYPKMRQLYTGNIDPKTGKPHSKDLMQLRKYDAQLNDLDNILQELSIEYGRSSNKNDQIQIQLRMGTYAKEKNKIINEHKKLAANIDKNIEKIYIITSQETFLNRITSKKTTKGYTTSSNLLDVPDNRKGNNGLPHPDCFHSDKAVLIIDEVQKITREGGTNYLRLHDTLLINARDRITGEPRMKVILLTATPIFDNPHEASLMLNFQRPRIPFPLFKQTFDDSFIHYDRETGVQKIKNKICYQYLFSGYVSYSQGANPKGFPLRRNILTFHKLENYQFNGYKDVLIREIDKDITNNKIDTKTHSAFFENIYKTGGSSSEQGTYMHSRQLCNIYLPKSKRKPVIHDSHDNDKEERAGEGELAEFIEKMKLLQKDKIMEQYAKYSTKFHYVIEKILESSKTQEGPIFVYCEWIYYGILAMSEILKLLGWTFLDKFDYDTSTKKFAIWSPGALGKMGIMKDEEYTAKLLKYFNDKRNADGSLCKVIFTTVTEGISLRRVSQMHITSPWWNEARTEQIIGRGIRFCSHADLDISKQYVDVYYHCSILPTFSDYSIHKVLDAEIIEVTKFSNFKDLARLTYEQLIFITARRKTSINNQFEVAIKETAVDFQLNSNSNLLRFEEVHNEFLKIKKSGGVYHYVKDNERILYSRGEDKYYHYNLMNHELRELKYELTGTDKKLVWPMLKAVVSNHVLDPENTWNQYESSIIVNDLNEEMVSFVVAEKLKSFNNDPNIRDKNFKQLMKYAISQGEDKNVWKYFNDQRIKTKMFSMLSSVYRLQDSEHSDHLINNFNNDILSNLGPNPKIRAKIISGNAEKDLTMLLSEVTREIADKRGLDKQTRYELLTLSHSIKKTSERMIEKKPITNQQVGVKEERMKRLFFNVDEGTTNQIIDKLVNDFNINRDEISNMGANDIILLYNTITADIRENTNQTKNKKKGR